MKIKPLKPFGVKIADSFLLKYQTWDTGIHFICESIFNYIVFIILRRSELFWD